MAEPKIATTPKLSDPLVVHITVRDPSLPWHDDYSWRCPGGETLFFARCTLWGPARAGHSDAEVEDLLRRIEAIRQQVLGQALVNPIISAAQTAPLRVNVVNALEEERARLGQKLLEAARPFGETASVAVDRNGSATFGLHRFDFPKALYLDVLNVGGAEQLSELNARLWGWLGPKGIREVEQDWALVARNPARERWSWFGNERAFTAQQTDLRALFGKWKDGTWSPDATDALAHKLRDADSVLTDRFLWHERHWARNRSAWSDAEIKGLDRWSGTLRPNSWPRGNPTPYRLVPVRTVVLHGVWPLVYWELSRDIEHKEAPAQCPECSQLLPFEPRRHSIRLCASCATQRSRDRKARWWRNRPEASEGTGKG